MTLPQLIDKYIILFVILALLIIPSTLGAIVFFTSVFSQSENQYTSTKLLWGAFEIGAPVIDKNQIISNVRLELEKTHKSELVKKGKAQNILVSREVELKKEAEKMLESLKALNSKQEIQIRTYEVEILNLNATIEKLLYKKSAKVKISELINNTNDNINISYVPSDTYTTHLVKKLEWKHDICKIDIDVLLQYGGHSKENCSYSIDAKGFSQAKVVREGAKVELDFFRAKHNPHGWCEDINNIKVEKRNQNTLDFVMNDAKSAFRLQEMLSTLNSSLPVVCQ
jgi:predicted RNase H-like nuclease (RuvC/YqgF family)